MVRPKKFGGGGDSLSLPDGNYVLWGGCGCGVDIVTSWGVVVKCGSPPGSSCGYDRSVRGGDSIQFLG